MAYMIGAPVVHTSGRIFRTYIRAATKVWARKQDVGAVRRLLRDISRARTAARATKGWTVEKNWIQLMELPTRLDLMFMGAYMVITGIPGGEYKNDKKFLKIMLNELKALRINMTTTPLVQEDKLSYDRGPKHVPGAGVAPEEATAAEGARRGEPVAGDRLPDRRGPEPSRGEPQGVSGGGREGGEGVHSPRQGPSVPR